MNGDHFSLKARRTTRIPLRIPVVLVISENGKSRSLDGWTMIVNVHGAKIECKRRFGMHEEVVVQVPFNGMSQKGKVVWSRSEPNENGNYEIGVELDRPENLWGVGFPPSDWESARRDKRSAAEAAILDLAPKDAIVAPPEPQVATPGSPSRECTSTETAAPVSETVTEEMYSAAPEELSQALELNSTAPQELSQESSQVFDLSDEISNFHQQLGEPTESAQGLCFEALVNQTNFHKDESAMLAAESAINSSPSRTTQNADAPASSGVPCAPARPELRFDQPRHSEPENPTDRLSAIFNELVDSALQARLLGLVEALGQRMEARVAEIESTAISRATERIEAVVVAQSQMLEQRAGDIVASQQSSLQQNVERLVSESETSVRERQQKFLNDSQAAMHADLEQMLQAGQTRLEQQAHEVALGSQHALRSGMEEQFPAIEKNLMERCLKQSENLMAGQVEQWTLLHADRTQQLQRSAEERLNQLAEQAAAHHAAALESKLSELASQTTTRLEQQLGRIGTQVRQTFLRHIVTELGRSQQVWVQQSQRQIEQAAADSMEKARLSLSQMMKGLGESLIQQAAIPPHNLRSQSCQANAESAAETEPHAEHLSEHVQSSGQ